RNRQPHCTLAHMPQGYRSPSGPSTQTTRIPRHMTSVKQLVALALALALAPTPASAQRPELETELHGLILVNAFANSEDVNNSDVPQFTLRPRPPGGLPSSAAGGTVRQSRVRVHATVSEFAGGQLTGDLDVDFFGGQQPSTGGRTFPLL